MLSLHCFLSCYILHSASKFLLTLIVQESADAISPVQESTIGSAITFTHTFSRSTEVGRGADNPLMVRRWLSVPFANRFRCSPMAACWPSFPDFPRRPIERERCLRGFRYYAKCWNRVCAQPPPGARFEGWRREPCQSSRLSHSSHAIVSAVSWGPKSLPRLSSF